MNYILFEDADNNLEWMPVNENGNFSVDSEQKVWKRRRLLDGCLNRLAQFWSRGINIFKVSF